MYTFVSHHSHNARVVSSRITIRNQQNQESFKPESAFYVSGFGVPDGSN